MILAYGIKKSTEQATDEHPYGYSNMQYVSSLISGVGIFCMGAGSTHFNFFRQFLYEAYTVKYFLIYNVELLWRIFFSN